MRQETIPDRIHDYQDVLPQVQQGSRDPDERKTPHRGLALTHCACERDGSHPADALTVADALQPAAAHSGNAPAGAALQLNRMRCPIETVNWLQAL